MIQKIRNIIDNFKSRQRAVFANKGQTSIILILVIAVALIVYSISLNWGRIAQYKTLTTIGANTAAANMASLFASYGEQQLQVTLGGRIEYCKRTSLIVLIVTAIIAIIIVVVSWGSASVPAYALVAAVVGAVLAVAAVVIHLTVVEPGLTRLWNRMQSNLPLDGQVVENAIMTGMQSVVSDQILISDHFDMDVDGLWVDNFDNGNIPEHKDTLGRFAFYYTKRLQGIIPFRIDAIDEFIVGVNELLYDNPYSKVGPGGCTPAEISAGEIRCQDPDNFGVYDPVCAGNIPAPYCDPCCQPAFDLDGVTPLRPDTCTPAQVAACGAGDYPVAPYTWQFDPVRENYTNAFYSLREQFGIDDENELYNRNSPNPNSPPPQTLAVFPDNVFLERDSTGFYPADNQRGIFPFLWNMNRLLPAEAINFVPPPAIPVIPRSDMVIIMTADPLNCTVATCPNQHTTPSTQCASVVAYDAGTNRPRTDGFWWRPGSDQWCSTVYPYSNCINKVGNCADGTFNGVNPPPCGCVAGDDPSVWHDDSEDNFVEIMKQFVGWATDFLLSDLDRLNSEFTTWYPKAAYWIAPRCNPVDNCDDSLATAIECRYCNNEINDGALIVWRDVLGGWVDLIDSWLYQSYADANAWCLPPAATAAATFTQDEKNVIPSLNPATPVPNDKDGTPIPIVWGDLNDTVACLNYNANNVARLTTCQSACLSSPTDYNGNANICLNLPRSVIDLNDSSGIPANNTAYQNAQRLQDCLSSTCSDSFGVTLPVCTGLPGIVMAPDCTAWGPANPYYTAIITERNNQFDLSDYCEPLLTPTTSFQDNLVLAIFAATAQDSGVNGIAARNTQLTALRTQALQVRQTLLSGYQNFNDFLRPCAPGLDLGDGCANCAAGGPAAKLICARRDFTPASTASLPNFAIYGWQGKAVAGRGPTGTDPDKGYWHIVRVEAFGPKRCYGQCLTERMPWVKTWTTGGFFNRKRCYGLKETDGMTIVRVTRWDEDRDSPGSRFVNGQMIWKFRFNNPGVASTTSPGNVLATDCQRPIAYDQGTSLATRILLDGAFMINNIPSADPNVSPVCWNMVNALLDRGVQTTTCARYLYDPGVNHMSLKFTTCPVANVQTAVGCARTGTCP